MRCMMGIETFGRSILQLAVMCNRFRPKVPYRRIKYHDDTVDEDVVRCLCLMGRREKIRKYGYDELSKEC